MPNMVDVLNTLLKLRLTRRRRKTTILLRTILPCKSGSINLEFAPPEFDALHPLFQLFPIDHSLKTNKTKLLTLLTPLPCNVRPRYIAVVTKERCQVPWSTPIRNVCHVILRNACCHENRDQRKRKRDEPTKRTAKPEPRMD
ncbi:hypothetical protein HanIR_Chr04g0189861 [Helianthus annuus]|nr:hypothetical protein HanIR_Chr04g0189861 [Helianthus annuus]